MISNFKKNIYICIYIYRRELFYNKKKSKQKNSKKIKSLATEIFLNHDE